MDIKLTYWKAILRRRYLAYQGVAQDLSCGAALADHITGGRLSRAKASLNEAVRKCQSLDPTCQLNEIP
jgi:hypothetical protein